MTGLEITYMVILSVCILASGFFSGSETALVGIQRERVPQLVESDRRGRFVEALISDPDAMLSTLLVANNFVNILAASVATVIFVDLLGQDWGPWAATGAVTSVILVIGEITPKSLATRYPERYSLVVAPLVWRLSLVLRPVSHFFLTISRGLMRLLGITSGDHDTGVTEADIRAMSVLAERSGDIEAAEREIIHSLFSLADLSVRDVMTTRMEIHSLSSPVTFEEVKAAVGATGHSRYPVIKEGLDDVLGEDRTSVRDAQSRGDLARRETVGNGHHAGAEHHDREVGDDRLVAHRHVDRDRVTRADRSIGRFVVRGRSIGA